MGETNSKDIPEPEFTVFIIDDTRINIDLLVGIFRDDYDIMVAKNGRDALKRVAIGKPDIILLDIMMPDMDGYEVCRCIKANPDTANIPIIFISAMNEAADKTKGFSLGAVDYITKPFNATEVKARIQTHLAFSRMRVALEEKSCALEDSIKHLKKTQTQLVESEKMAALGTLVAGVAHEINTPLGNNIMLITSLLDVLDSCKKRVASKQLTKSDLTEFLDMFEQHATMALEASNRIVKLIFSFKKVSVGFSDQAGHFNVRQAIEDTVLVLQDQLNMGHHQVEIEGGEVVVNSFCEDFQSIISTLISNAIEHGFRGLRNRRIRIVCEFDQECLKMTCADNGVGIQAQDVEQLFEPFFTTQRSTMTGLGLHIVFNLISHNFKGSITCHSVVDEGTQFVLELPMRSTQ